MASGNIQECSQATIRFVVDNFSKLDDTAFSPPTEIGNLPWKIMVMKMASYSQAASPAGNLGYFLQCNGESESPAWSCNAFAQLKLISQKEGAETRCRKIYHQFHYKQNDWGFSSYMPWTDVIDPKKGFIKDDTVIFEADIYANVPDRLPAANENKPAIVTQQPKENVNINSQNDTALCQICMDKERNTAFEPCRHFVSCNSCASLITKCPVCRTKIDKIRKIYMS